LSAVASNGRAIHIEVTFDGAEDFGPAMYIDGQVGKDGTVKATATYLATNQIWMVEPYNSFNLATTPLFAKVSDDVEHEDHDDQGLSSLLQGGSRRHHALLRLAWTSVFHIATGVGGGCHSWGISRVFRYRHLRRISCLRKVSGLREGIHRIYRRR